MSTKAQAVLEQIRALPEEEMRELRQQINRIAAESETLSAPTARVSDGEFAAALDEVTGCTAGRNGLQRLLEDRRRDREHDEAYLEARKRERTRG